MLSTWHPAGMMRYQAKAARSFLIHLGKAVEAALGKKADPPPKILFNPSLRESWRAFHRWKEFAIDIETPSTTSDRILSIAVAGEGTLALVWDLQGKPLLSSFRAALLSDRLKIFQNGEFDLLRLERNGFKVRKLSGKKNLIWDTMIEGQILHPDEPANLSYLASIYCDVGAWKHTRKSEDRREFLRYNALDAIYTFRVWGKKGKVE